MVEKAGNFFFPYSVGSSLVYMGFLSLRQVRATLCCCAQASHCSGFSCCRTRALDAQASVVVARWLRGFSSRGLKLGVRSCGAQV